MIDENAERMRSQLSELTARGDWGQALGVLRELCAADPDDADLFYQLGVIWEKHGNPSEAISAFQRVLELDPNHHDAAAALRQSLELLPHNVSVVPEPFAAPNAVSTVEQAPSWGSAPLPPVGLQTSWPQKDVEALPSGWSPKRKLSLRSRRIAFAIGIFALVGGISGVSPRITDLHTLALLTLLVYAGVIAWHSRDAKLSMVLLTSLTAIYGIAGAIVSHSRAKMSVLAIVSSLGIGLLSAAIAALAARLSRPVSIEWLKRRYSRIVCVEAFKDLGLQARMTSVLPRWDTATEGTVADDDNPVFLYNKHDRLAVSSALIASLKELQLPRIGVTAQEVYSCRAVRPIADRECAKCGGTGTLQLSASLPTQDTEQFVSEEGGTADYVAAPSVTTCSCVEEVYFAIPYGASSGFVAHGACTNPNHTHYATINSAALTNRLRPLLVSIFGFSGLLAGFAGLLWIALTIGQIESPGTLFASAGLGVSFALWAAASVPMLKGRQAGWAMMRMSLVISVLAALIIIAISAEWGVIGFLQNGLTMPSLVVHLFCLAGLAVMILILRLWHLPTVTAFFLRADAIDLLGPAHGLTFSDRLANTAGLPEVKGVAWATGVCVSVWLLLSLALGPYWTMFRADVADSTGGVQASVDLYQDAAREAKSTALARRALVASHGVMIRHIEDVLIKGSDNRFSPMESELLSGWCETMAVDQRALLGKDRAAQVAGLAFACSEEMVKTEAWGPAKTTLNALEVGFPSSEIATKARERSEWRFVQLQSTSTTDDVESRVYLTTTGIDAVPELEYEHTHPSKGHTFLKVQIQVAHLGRSVDELPAGYFVLFDGHGQSFFSIGLERSDEVDGTALRGMTSLKKCEYTGVGPDLSSVTMVFELPKEPKPYSLMIKGKRATTISF